jgi:hypothetical protein
MYLKEENLFIYRLLTTWDRAPKCEAVGLFHLCREILDPVVLDWQSEISKNCQQVWDSSRDS